MSLREQLHRVEAAAPDRIPPDAWEVMQRNRTTLAESGILDSAVSVADRAPAFTLPSATGRPVALSELLDHGPVVLTFYRGAWCPFCNLALRALQDHHAEITARGARLVAVSPQVPDESLSLSQKHALDFEVLSDRDCAVAGAYGISFDLSDELEEIYRGFGFDLETVNGGNRRTLPLPASYVIRPEGTIAWAFVETDYTKRAEPADILAALDALAG